MSLRNVYKYWYERACGQRRHPILAIWCVKAWFFKWILHLLPSSFGVLDASRQQNNQPPMYYIYVSIHTPHIIRICFYSTIRKIFECFICCECSVQCVCAFCSFFFNFVLLLSGDQLNFYVTAVLFSVCCMGRCGLHTTHSTYMPAAQPHSLELSLRPNWNRYPSKCMSVGLYRPRRKNCC